MWFSCLGPKEGFNAAIRAFMASLGPAALLLPHASMLWGTGSNSSRASLFGPVGLLNNIILGAYRFPAMYYHDPFQHMKTFCRSDPLQSTRMRSFSGYSSKLRFWCTLKKNPRNGTPKNNCANDQCPSSFWASKATSAGSDSAACSCRSATFMVFLLYMPCSQDYCGLC